jgi:hypothetical protein
LRALRGAHCGVGVVACWVDTSAAVWTG